jgi:hypothetical protein
VPWQQLTLIEMLQLQNAIVPWQQLTLIEMLQLQNATPLLTQQFGNYLNPTGHF